MEEAEPIIESHSPIVEPAGEEMVGTTDMPKPNVETKTTRMVNEPKSVNEKMAMKVPMPEPKLQAKRLKKMTMKKNTKRRQLVK